MARRTSTYRPRGHRRRRERPQSWARFAVDALLAWAAVAAVTWLALPQISSMWAQATMTPEQRAAIERSVYYANCDAARAAGAAPIYRGSPGYREGMDGDSDGIACEPYR